jgi:hypothetical protein
MLRCITFDTLVQLYLFLKTGTFIRPIETIKSIFCTRWYEDTSFKFTVATLSSAVIMSVLQPCIDWLNSFNLLKISARYASYCNEETSEKYFANGISVSDKKQIATSSSVETLSSKSYHETASKLRYDTGCPCHCRTV